jgi:hypothetical protein
MKPPVATPPMTLARLAELLDAYGARPESWPSAERNAAQLLLRESADAQRLVADAAELDGVLNDYEVAEEVSPALRARVLEVPIVTARKRRRFGFRMAWAVAFSCLIGVASGAWSAPEASADDDEWAELTEVSFYADADADPDVTTVEEVP